jgi:tetratricopeptide (TPR) repeat protein
MNHRTSASLVSLAMGLRPLRIATVLVMLTSAVLPACGPKTTTSKGWDEETMGQDPTANFDNGVYLLSNPDKTGAVDYTTAYQRFDKAAALGAGAKAHYNAAYVAEILGTGPDVERPYRAAVEADPTYEKAVFAFAKWLEDEGRADAAATVYQGWLAQKPDDMETRNSLMAALAESKQYDAAIAEGQEILRKDSKNAGVYRNLSAMYYAQGNYGMSQLCAEKALALNDGDAGIYNNMAVTYLEQGDEPAAIEKLKTARQLAPNAYEPNLNLGFVALNSGDYALALDCFEKATTANPSSVEAKLGLAVAARGTLDFARAGATYDEVIKADPNNQQAYFNAATLYEKYVKDYTKAGKYLDAYITQNQGKIGPTHEVFARLKRVEESKAAEEKRKAEEAARKKEEEERQKRNEEILASMTAVVTDLKAKVAAQAACVGEDMVMEVDMVVEQAQEVINTKDAGMASDMQMMISGYTSMVDEAIAACGGAAPAPEAGTAEGAPADGAAPAEAAPPAEEETKSRPEGQ